MTVSSELDAQLARIEATGLTPTTIILSYEDHWRLSYHDLGGPDVGYPRPRFPYQLFVERYQGLPIICPGLGHHEPPTVGVRADAEPATEPEPRYVWTSDTGGGWPTGADRLEVRSGGAAHIGRHSEDA